MKKKNSIGTGLTHKAYKFRMYPSATQREVLSKTFGGIRVVWNTRVAQFNNYNFEGPLSASHYCQSLVDLKKVLPYLQEVSAAALQQVDLDWIKTKAQYFSKDRAKKLGRPKFKKKFGRQSYRLDGRRVGIRGTKVRIEKVGLVKLVPDRALPDLAVIKSATISKEVTGDYYISFLCEVPQTLLPKTGKSVGIDLGLIDLFVTSDGARHAAPKHFRENQAKLKKCQRSMSRKTKGSSRYRKAKLKTAKVHRSIVRQRRHNLHVLSYGLVKLYDFIGLETLNVQGMMANGKLAKSVADAGFSEFTAMLEYKALHYGKTVQRIDTWFPSSKLCNCCDHKNESLSLSEREFVCSNCGTILDRDLNAARNILKEAVRVNTAIRMQSDCNSEASAEVCRDEASRPELLPEMVV